MSSKKRNISIKIRKEIIKHKEEHPGISQRSLAKLFDVSVGSINKILRDKEVFVNIRDNTETIVKKRKLSKTSDFDEILYMEVQNNRKRNFCNNNY